MTEDIVNAVATPVRCRRVKGAESMFVKHLARLASEEEAVVAAEYAVLLSLISMVCVIASTEMGRWLSETMENVADALPEVDMM